MDSPSSIPTPPKKRGGKILSFVFGFILAAIIFSNHATTPQTNQPATAVNTNPTVDVADTLKAEPQIAGVKIDSPTSTPTEQPDVQADVVAASDVPAVVAPENKPKVQPTPAIEPKAAAPNGTYTNVDGNEVPRPYAAPSAPAGASARCGDGTYSFSQHRSGTCSHHGGVAEWL